MRVCLVAHGYPPRELTGVESHCEALAGALVRAGCEVLVFAPRRGGDLPHLALRRQDGGGHAIHWLTLHPRPSGESGRDPGPAVAFGGLLDRERPDLVHFQHLEKLGFGLIGEARRRGIPTLYTAHDYHPVCHRQTLVRPDLSPCEEPGRPELCARCDRAAGFLNEHAELGDWQSGALPSQLDSAAARRLAGILAGEGVDAELASAVERSRQRSRQRSAERAAAFEDLNAILATSDHLAERLVRGGIDPARLERHDCGIDLRILGDVLPPRTEGALRFGYLGGLSKHKGVHVLLSAWERVAEGAGELSIRGDSTDRPYVASLRRRAEELGVGWGGGVAHERIAECFAEIDVLVVPSVWAENAAFVVREAFAASRPVIASRVGALPESVREGIDGLLVEPGDPADLARAIERCLAEPGLVARLAGGVRAPRGIDAEARELVERYRRLVERPAGDPPLPSLAPFLERWRDLSRRPLRELAAVVLGGLEVLDRQLDAGTAPLPAPASGGRVLDALTALKAEVAWLRESLREREAESGGRAEALERAGAAVEALEAERAWLRELWEGARAEASWRAERDDVEEREREWLGKLASAREAELEWLRGVVADLERADRTARDELRDSRREAAELDRELSALREHEAWLRRAAMDLVSAISSLERAEGGEWEAAAVDPALVRAREVLEGMRAELEWRRGEMEAAAADGGALARWIVARSALGRRLDRWRGDLPGEGGAP